MSKLINHDVTVDNHTPTTYSGGALISIRSMGSFCDK
jgi:hypothetical protein